MKILFIVDYYYPSVGGAETLYKQLAEGLVSQGHEIVVLTQCHDRSLAKEEVLNGVRIYRVYTWHRVFFPYQAFSLARKVVRDVDIIQSATYSSGILAWRLKKVTKLPVYIIVHEYLSRRWLDLGFAGLVAYVYEKYLFAHRFDRYIAVSQSTQNQLLNAGIKSAKLTYIYNGIDYKHFMPQKSDFHLRESLQVKSRDILYLFSGRLGITKGVMLLLQAWQKWQRPTNVKLLLILGVADDIEKEKLDAFIQLYSLQESVIVISAVSYKELPRYIASANVVVVPSLTEGFGFFAAEVCAMQMPVIVNPVDALPEVVSGKVIITKSVDAQSLTEALQKAFDGYFDNIPSKTFAWSDTVAKYEKLYQGK